MEPTDFKNIIVENIPPTLSEDAEVAEVKRPRNSKRHHLVFITFRNRTFVLLSFEVALPQGPRHPQKEPSEYF